MCGRAPGRHPGEARSSRAVRFFVSPWCNGRTASSNLAGPGSTPGGFAFNERRGPERLGYLVRAFGPAVRIRLRPAFHDRDVTLLLRAEADPVIPSEGTVAGSSPARSTWCSGSSVVEQSFRAAPTRPQQIDRKEGDGVVPHPVRDATRALARWRRRREDPP